MECSREEVFGAVENKFKSHDFAGAHALLLKAQQLYPGLENVAQMLAILDVHCVAHGSDKDWYGILQVEPTADVASIQKQYRKFALLLHPDKNKFYGAEAAFKLVGEAMTVLSDQTKRTLHDIKRRATINGNAVLKSSRFQCYPSNGHFGMKQSNIQTQAGIHVRVQTQTDLGGIHVRVQTQPSSVPHQRNFSTKQGTNDSGKGSATGTIPQAGNNNAEDRELSNMEKMLGAFCIAFSMYMLVIAFLIMLILIHTFVNDVVELIALFKRIL